MSSIKEYDKQKVIWAGERCTVWLVKKINSGEKFAMKEINIKLVIEKNLSRNVWNERKALEDLNEKNIYGIIKLYDVFKTERNLYLVFELAECGSLNQHIKRSVGFDLNKVRFYTAEIAYTLGELHRNGYIYRDLKASNVVLKKSGRIKLIDFGCAKNLTAFQKKRTKSFCGTFHSMAPEVYSVKKGLSTKTETYTDNLKSENKLIFTNSALPPFSSNHILTDSAGYAYAVDWWSLGILVYEMIFWYFLKIFCICLRVCN